MGILSDKLLADHERLDRLLSEALDSSGVLNEASFEAFRKGLLRHIGIEEKLLFPAARKAGLVALPAFDQARRDHSQLVSLLVPIPTAELIERIRALLIPHNRLEEESDGLYERCERVIGEGATELAERIDKAPAVPVRPHRDVRPLLRKDDSSDDDHRHETLTGDSALQFSKRASAFSRAEPQLPTSTMVRLALK